MIFRVKVHGLIQRDNRAFSECYSKKEALVGGSQWG